MKKYLRSIWLAIPVIAGLAFVSFRQDDRLFEIARNLDIYATLFKELNAYYVDEINPNQLIKTSIDNMLRSLDPYTVYYAEDDIEDYMTMTTGKYNGIGAIISSAEGKHTVIMVYEDTPAQKAGLQVGDEIMKINGIDLSTREDFDTGKLLKGQSQTNVTLTVKRYGITKPLEISLN